MLIDQYQEQAMRTSVQQSDHLQLLNAALGLGGESGEVIDLIKKYAFHGKELDTVRIAEELGDVLWYIALTCKAIGVPMSVVAQMNIDKLQARWPQGFKS